MEIEMDDAFIEKVRTMAGALSGVFVPDDIATRMAIAVAVKLTVEELYDDDMEELNKRIDVLEAALRKTHSVLFMSIDYRGYKGGPLSMPFASLAEREASDALASKLK
jgi:hypothetical protein